MSANSPVVPHDLDVQVFSRLNEKAKTKEDFDKWKGKASDIVGYVAAWGVIRFWSLSFSPKGKGGTQPSAENFDQNYYAWQVAREVLCEVVDNDFGLNDQMTAKDFNQHYKDNLTGIQQVILSELLIEIGNSIQFWTMRIADSFEATKAEESEPKSASK